MVSIRFAEGGGSRADIRVIVTSTISSSVNQSVERLHAPLNVRYRHLHSQSTQLATWGVVRVPLLFDQSPKAGIISAGRIGLTRFNSSLTVHTVFVPSSKRPASTTVDCQSENSMSWVDVLPRYMTSLSTGKLPRGRFLFLQFLDFAGPTSPHPPVRHQHTVSTIARRGEGERVVR